MKIVDLLGGQAEYYLNHTCKTIDKQLIHIPGPDMIDKVWMNSDRNIRTLESLQALYGHGRLANTGYVSILPVDQGIEHSAGASFAHVHCPGNEHPGHRAGGPGFSGRLRRPHRDFGRHRGPVHAGPGRCRPPAGRDPHL